jgi:hypothetical protein
MQDETLQLGGPIRGFTEWNITTMVEALAERAEECEQQHPREENDYWKCPVCSQLRHITDFIQTIVVEYSSQKSLLHTAIPIYNDLIDEKNAKIDELTAFIRTIRPRSDAYDRVCQSLGIENDILGHIDREYAKAETIREWLKDHQSNLSERAYYELTSLVGEPE